MAKIKIPNVSSLANEANINKVIGYMDKMDEVKKEVNPLNIAKRMGVNTSGVETILNKADEIKSNAEDTAINYVGEKFGIDLSIMKSPEKLYPNIMDTYNKGTINSGIIDSISKDPTSYINSKVTSFTEEITEENIKKAANKIVTKIER